MLEVCPLGLYIHFPWCVRKCPYCDFNSFTLHGELAEEQYIAALQRDLEAQAAAVSGRTISTIFLGGGTPSLFQPRSIGRVLETARSLYAIAPHAEVTLEANPGTIERGRFKEYREAGVNRVSLGAQSFDAQALRILGRIHTPGESCFAAQELHAAGLANFNLDLMYALPRQDVAGARADVEAALALQPAHLSHYQLTIEPATAFAAHPPELPADDAAADMLLACREQLAAKGFVQYEVSAYAKSGRQCAHNLNYWTFGDYLGVGAGAHGKLTVAAAGSVAPAGAAAAAESAARAGSAGRAASIVRTLQPREPRRYMAQAHSGPARRAVAEHELPFEFMMNALRCVAGFPIDLFSRRTGLDWQLVSARVQRLAARELVLTGQDHVRPSPRGLLFLNDALLEFLPETPQSTGAFGMSTAF